MPNPRESQYVRTMPRLWAMVAALALIPTLPAAAQPAQQSTSYDRAIAAGYKAAFLCSGIFNAGRTEAQVAAMELTGIYPEYAAIVPSLPATIDRKAKTVSVPFDSKLPPRVAAWRPSLGCAQLPIGADPATVAHLPRIAQTPPDLDARPWPMGDKDALAAPKGNRAALDRAIAAAFDGKTHGARSRTTGVLVLQQGRIVGEHYAPGFGPHVSQRTWSVAKSLAGTVLGVAAEQGLLFPGDKANLPEWRRPGDPRAAITVGQLIRMSSGLHSDTAGNRTDALYFGGTAVTEQATAWPIEAQPGSRFRYANNDILLAMRALRARMRDRDYLAFPFTQLFWKIGMTRTVPETDWRGDFILSSQVWTTARDLARFGLLYLNDGAWNGQRILRKDWAHYVAEPIGPQPSGEFGYGSTFWLLNDSKGVPKDAYAAFGNRGQYVVIVPSRGVVIVRRGEDPTGGNFQIAPFVAAVLSTLQ